jgi:hypothetical protein
MQQHRATRVTCKHAAWQEYNMQRIVTDRQNGRRRMASDYLMDTLLGILCVVVDKDRNR